MITNIWHVIRIITTLKLTFIIVFFSFRFFFILHDFNKMSYMQIASYSTSTFLYISIILFLIASTSEILFFFDIIFRYTIESLSPGVFIIVLALYLELFLIVILVSFFCYWNLITSPFLGISEAASAQELI